MLQLVTFTLGVLAGTALLLIAFSYAAVRRLAGSGDINDAPCLVCDRWTCECGE